MHLLVLGGSKFLGRHIVDAALAAGQEVTLFNRGQTNPDLFRDVEHIAGDRDGNLVGLEGRSFDAVIDTSGYLPRHVRATAQMLRDAATNYCFISSISVYASFSEQGLHEDAPTTVLEDPASEDIKEDYGALKALCEDEVHEAFEDAALIVRPGLIVGPHDPTNRFTYWVTRLAEGGDVLAPGPEERPVQVIDARDVARWIVTELEDELSGTFNATGPEEPLAFDEMLAACGTAVGTQAHLEWVDEPFVLDQGIKAWSELPVWLPAGWDGMLTIDNSKAVGSGLTFRPLDDTARDTYEWVRSLDVPPGDAGLDRSKEAELLKAWAER